MLKLKSFPLELVAKTSSHYNKSFHAKVFTLFASSESELKSFAEHSPAHYDYCLCFMEKDEGQWFLDTTSLSRVRDWVAKGARAGVGHVSKLYKIWEKEWDTYKKLSGRLLSVDLSQLSQGELKKEFANFYSQYLKAGSVAYIADTFMSSGETDWLEEQLKSAVTPKKTTFSLQQTIRALTLPLHLSFTIEEEIELLKIAQKIQSRYPNKLPPFKKLSAQSPTLAKLLTKHEQKFYWIKNNYHNVEFLTAEYFYKQVQLVIKNLPRQGSNILARTLRQKLAHIKAFKQLRQQTLKVTQLTPYAKNLLEIARLFSKWKDVRKSGVYMGMEHFDRFLKEIGRRNRLPERDINFLVFDEIINLFTKNSPNFKKIINKRKRHTFFAFTPKGYFLVEGDKARPYFKYVRRGHSTEIAELKGVTASPGKASGKARVIRKTEEMQLFKKDEILITNQTTPEFVPIMKKAGAIVTEQGGITSHAAVVSRELNKPCIIGTKIATTVFQTGDLVEVDANKGTVKKI